MKRLKKAVWQLLNKVELGGGVQLMLHSALTENGWFRSYHTKQSIDRQGNPIPWCTYPFIQFIKSRLHQQMNVFEFGCGNSTIWYAPRVKSIKAVEHDEAWVHQVQSKLPANASVIHRNLDAANDYPNEVRTAGISYHLIIIDGRKRNECAAQAMNCLTDDGVIVWDNSDRTEYQPAILKFIHAHFKRIDFWGMCPVASHLTCTSILYRTNNCLGI